MSFSEATFKIPQVSKCKLVEITKCSLIYNMKSMWLSRPEHVGLYGLLLAFLPNQRLVDVRDHTWEGRKTPKITQQGRGKINVAVYQSVLYLHQQWWLWSTNPAPHLLWWPAASGAGLYASPSGPWTRFQPIPAPWRKPKFSPTIAGQRAAEAGRIVTSAVRYSRIAAL